MSRAATQDDVFDAVLAAARVGAPWALGKVWNGYSPAVHAFLRARGAAEPEDLTSEVFLAVFEALPTFDGGEAGFRSFVFTIVYRRLVDDFRARSRRPLEVEWDPESDGRCSASAEHEALSGIGDAETRKLLDTLAPDQRDVLVLRIVADLSIEEVAAILRKRPGAVKALQRRGLEALRKKLSPTRTLSGRSGDSED
ncbi:sigma-70 family RNA polymerase sigma factor [Naasia sp. SYSU D00948]|uniref:RNA polymerase sigma factor n=1 Tax=Naasia sp. SYSU D00948 TaxID=2817379 RepID=UPI0027DBC6DD|nr:sigma-70 family RNA polymerase sigma factor [Naasia sp. SYSU D00948]